MADELLRKLVELRKRTSGANREDPPTEQIITTTTTLHTTTRLPDSAPPPPPCAGSSPGAAGSSSGSGASGGPTWSEPRPTYTVDAAGEAQYLRPAREEEEKDPVSEGAKARDRPKGRIDGYGPDGQPERDACWQCGSRDPWHTAANCPENPKNKLLAGLCERPGCKKAQHTDFLTCWDCRKYRRNTERHPPERPPSYHPTPGGGAGGYGAGPNTYRSPYQTGQSAPPHPKRWYYVSPASSLPGGTYTYNSLRRHLEPQGGWSATDSWGQGSFQGFVEPEPALKRTVQAGLRRPDGSLPVYYD